MSVAFPPELAVAAHPAQHVVPVGRALKIRRGGLGEDDGPGNGFEGGALRRVDLAVGGGFRAAAGDVDIAAVQLEIVDAPGGKEARVLEKVVVAAALGLAAAGQAAAGGGAGVLIDAELQPQGMDGLGHALMPWGKRRGSGCRLPSASRSFCIQQSSMVTMRIAGAARPVLTSARALSRMVCAV